MKQENWFSYDLERVLELQSSSLQGLSAKEAQRRLVEHGRNVLPHKKRDSVFKILVKQLLDPIVILLIITVVFSFLINEIVDACAIIFIILIDLLMGTFQEWKAEKNAESLTNLIKVNVKVLRGGVELEIDSSELVVGDIVLLESGNKISADARILDCHNLQVDESVLTGESTNVYKNEEIIQGDPILAERKNMVYAGSNVVTGRATCCVVATALDTEIGKIADKVTNTENTKSPLTIRMEKFSKQISCLIVVIAIIIALILLYKKVPGSEIFLSVIALSVSAMPEGLPLALTMALTIASNKMAKKNVLVKKLNSVESLGSCTVIASDKTGTLTVNEQTAKQIILPNNETYQISGTGYYSKGEVTGEKEFFENVKWLCLMGMINNEAGLNIEKKERYGDSIDIAFLTLANKIGVDSSEIEILGEIPYESENKYSAVFYRYRDEVRCTVKGSVEKIMQFSKEMIVGNQIQGLSEDLINQQNSEFAQKGYRLIALADGKVSDFVEKEDYIETDIPSLQFLGMVAFLDPVREEVKNSIKECMNAGIKVVMITGDHPLTAFAIAKELGLVNSYEEVTTGTEVLEKYEAGKEVFEEFVKGKHVYTRVTPMDKLEIVSAYRSLGEFVAVTGDGVNDAPAIKVANIGIAMGSGTDVAKETADMIVVDDNFKSIVDGVKEGRTAYSNIRKVSYMLLSCGFAEVLFFVLSILFNLPMPLVAIQLLWLNIVTDGLQDFALSFEKTEIGTMEEPPRNTKESVFNKELLWEVLIAGCTIGLIVFGIWSYLIRGLHMDTSVARGYIMVLMVFMQNIHVLNCRSETHSLFKIGILSNPFVIFSIISSIILQVIVMEVPFFSKFLQTTTMPVMDMIRLFGFSCIVFVVMECYKLIKNKVRKKLS